MNINTTIHGPGGHLTKTKITNWVSRNEYKSKKYKQIEVYKTSQWFTNGMVMLKMEAITL